jgi:hypothetical protein
VSLLTKAVLENLGVSLTAGESITAKSCVYISAANTVMMATSANAAKKIGIAKDSANLNDPVSIILSGKVTGVVADEAISAGDMVTPSGSNAGRLVVFNPATGAGSAHNHTASSGNESSHTHAVSGNTGNESSHTHAVSGNTGSESSHVHAINAQSAGTPSGTIGSEAAHTHPGGGATSGPSASSTFYLINTAPTLMYASLTDGGVCDDAFNGVTSTQTYGVPSQTHTHTTPTTGAGSSHTHSFTGDALATHNHTGGTGAGSSHLHAISFTSGAGSSHNHGINFTSGAGSAHNHTITVNNESSHTHATNIGKCVGKAITAAAGAGNTFDMIVFQ